MLAATNVDSVLFVRFQGDALEMIKEADTDRDGKVCFAGEALFLNVLCLSRIQIMLYLVIAWRVGKAVYCCARAVQSAVQVLC